MTRTTIKWTPAAKKSFSKVPLRSRRAILAKIRSLADHENPTEAHKPLRTPLAGYFSIRSGRYRAIYEVREETLANGDTLVHLCVVVVMVGLRREGDRSDVYELTKRLLKYGGLEIAEMEEDSDDE